MKSKLAVILLTAVFGFGCASSGFVKIENDWANDKWEKGASEKVMILALFNDPGGREDLEDAFAIHLRKEGIRAAASRNFIPTFKDVTRESVREAVVKEGFDAVLTIRLVDMTAGKHSYKSDWFARSEMLYYNSFYNYYDEASIGVFTMARPGKGTTDYIQVKVETNLYATDGDGTLLYSGISQGTTSRRLGEARAEFVKAISKRLGRLGLL